MKRTSLFVAITLMLHMSPASAQETLQGDEKLACEALLCLSTSTRPAECAPSLRRYFSISYRKFSDTLRGRMNFLNMCPIVSSNMAAYKSALINGSGRCDAASINQSNYVSNGDGAGIVSSNLPDYCQTYYGSQYMQSTPPVYVGAPSDGGYWVEAHDYDAALKAYNASKTSLPTAPAN